MSWAAAAQATGTAVGQVAGLVSGKKMRRHARAESLKNRQFQERMSSTAWRRGARDMKLAGINPIYAAQKGGASTPSGSMALQQSSAADIATMGQAGGSIGMNLAQMARLKQDTATSAAQQDKLQTGQGLDLALRDKAIADKANSAASAIKTGQDIKLGNPKVDAVNRFFRTVLEPIFQRTENFIGTGKDQMKIFEDDIENEATVERWKRDRKKYPDAPKSQRQYIIPPKYQRK